MARIPDEQIDRLKQEVSVQRTAEGMGITFKRHGADPVRLQFAACTRSDTNPVICQAERALGLLLCSARSPDGDDYSSVAIGVS